MAVKTLRSLVLPMLLLGVTLLLFGCGEKSQTVSDAVKRSDSFSTDGSVSGDDAGSGEEKGESAPENSGRENSGSNGTDGGTVSREEKGANPDQLPAAPDEKIAAAGDKEGSRDNSLPPNNGDNGNQPDNAGDQNQPNNTSNQATPQNSPEKVQGAVPAKANPQAGPNNNEPVEIKFSEMYAGSSSRGLKFSDKLTGLNGKKVVITGYMAPPLKPAFDFFVLTRQPMAICPFCDSDASWPEDIVLIYLPKGENRTPTDSILTVTGTLELGSHTDPDTGFVSQARIYSDKIKVVR